MPWVFMESTDGEYNPEMCPNRGPAQSRIMDLVDLLDSEMAACELFLVQYHNATRVSLEIYASQEPYRVVLKALREKLGELIGEERDE